MELIPVSKDGAYLEVHPTTLKQHKELGWRECEKQEAEVEADKSMTKAELQSALDEKGIDYKPAMSKAELQTAQTGKGIEHKPAMSKAELQAMLGAA